MNYTVDRSRVIQAEATKKMKIENEWNYALIVAENVEQLATRDKYKQKIEKCKHSTKAEYVKKMHY